MGVLNGLDNELTLAYRLVNDLLPLVDAYGQMTDSALNYKDAAYRLGYIANSQAGYIQELEKTVNMLIPFVEISNIWANDSFQHEQVLLTVLDCLQNPSFLAYWAFKVWSNQQLTIEDIQYLGNNFQELLAPYAQAENQQNPNQQPVQIQQVPLPQLQGSGVPYGFQQNDQVTIAPPNNNYLQQLQPQVQSVQQFVPTQPQVNFQQAQIQQAPVQFQQPQQNISISTPSPTSYNSNTANPLQQVLMAMRNQGVSGLVNARKAGVI